MRLWLGKLFSVGPDFRRCIIWVAGCLVCVSLCLSADLPDYANAETLIQHGMWDQGIALLEPFLRAHPRDPKAWNLMGIALSGKGELAKANEEFRQALSIDPHFYHSLKNLAVNEFNLNDVKASERDLNAVMKITPDDAIVHTYLGEIAYGRHDYAQAANHFAKAGRFVFKDPRVALHEAESFLETHQSARALEVFSEMDKSESNLKIQFAAGLALARHDLFREAIPYFQAVRRRYPDSVDAAFNLSLCYIETKQSAPAIDILGDIVHQGRQTAELDNLLAAAYEGDHQTTQALETLRDATQIARKDEKNYLDFAAICLTHEFHKLGLEAIEVGLHYLPNSERLVFQRGVFNAMLGQYDLAEKDFLLSSKLAPERDLAYVGLGLTYIQQANLPEALRVLRQRVKEKHGADDPMLLYLLGDALIRTGAAPGHPAFDEAQAALEKSVKSLPSYSRSHVDLAKLYLMQGRLDDAIRLLEKARELDPKNTSVYSHLASAYRRKGKLPEAKAMLDIMAKLNQEELARVYPVARAMEDSSAQGSASKGSEREAPPDARNVPDGASAPHQ